MRRKKASPSRGKAAAGNGAAEGRNFPQDEAQADPELVNALLLHFMQETHLRLELSTVKAGRQTGLKRQHVRRLLRTENATDPSSRPGNPHPTLVTVLKWCRGFKIKAGPLISDLEASAQRIASVQRSKKGTKPGKL